MTAVGVYATGPIRVGSPGDRGPFYVREFGSPHRFTGSRAECYLYRCARVAGASHDDAAAAAVAAATVGMAS